MDKIDQAIEVLEAHGHTVCAEGVADLQTRVAALEQENLGLITYAPEITKIEDCERRCAELERDAGRYAYLRSEQRLDALTLLGPSAGVWCDCEGEDGVLLLVTGEDLDTRIDAAIDAAKEST